MPYRVIYTVNSAARPTLKASVTVTQDRASRSNLTLAIRDDVGSFRVHEPLQLICNTISSPTFGGTVRTVTQRRRPGAAVGMIEAEVDDWTTQFNQVRPMRTYTSLAAHSIVANLVDAFAGGFTPDVPAVKSETASLAWDVLTVRFDASHTVSECIDSVVGACAALPGFSADRPTWWITPQRTVRMVGAGSSIGAPLTITDTDLDLLDYEVMFDASSLVTDVMVWGGSTTSVYPEVAGATVLTAYDSRGFLWGTIGSLVGTNTAWVWVSSTNEMIQVESVNGNVLAISSQAYPTFAEHLAIPSGAMVRAVTWVQSLARANAVGSLVGSSGQYYAKLETNSYSVPDLVQAGQAIGNSLLYEASQETVQIRLRTFNSLAMPGGVLATSLTGAGVYKIERVTIDGFDRGEQLRPIYTVEAGGRRTARITDLF